MKRFVTMSSALILFIIAALAQTPAPPAPSSQLTPQVLADMLRSATTFHDLVQNLDRSLGPDVHTIGPNGLPQHSVERTAATIGAGAGVGAAIGSMTHKQNGPLIGAFIGGAGGLIIDEILKHREQAQPSPVPTPVP
jgi:hypothetical protein